MTYNRFGAVQTFSTKNVGVMTAVILYLRSLRRLKKEEQDIMEKELCSKIGMQARVRLFQRLPSFPWIALNPHWWKRGEVMTEHGGEKKYKVLRFRDRKGRPFWHEYPVDSIKVLSETE